MDGDGELQCAGPKRILSLYIHQKVAKYRENFGKTTRFSTKRVRVFHFLTFCKGKSGNQKEEE